MSDGRGQTPSGRTARESLRIIGPASSRTGSSEPGDLGGEEAAKTCCAAWVFPASTNDLRNPANQTNLSGSHGVVLGGENPEEQSAD